MKTPILLLIFNRPDNVIKVVNALRKIKPKTIYLAADGPRKNASSDKAKCALARKTALDQIDWPCTVHKLFRKSNLGCKNAVVGALDWFFRHVEQGIILEDDCIPNISFFSFCEELLEKYKSNTSIHTISGNNFHAQNNFVADSYYFSAIPQVWGWATWRRVWILYDKNISDWPKRKTTTWIKKVTGNYIISKYWSYIFDRMYRHEIDTWDYQLVYLCFTYSGLNIIPSVNLVTNIGYGIDATHTKHKTKHIGLDSKDMKFPLTHPRVIKVNTYADREMTKEVFMNPLIVTSLLLKSIFGKL